MKTRWRRSFRVLAITLWAVAIVLALELSAAVAHRWSLRHNDLIREAGDPPGRRSYASASSEPAPLPPLSPARAVDWFAAAGPPRDLALWETPATLETDSAERGRRRAFFLGLDERDRQFFTIIQNDTVAVFAPNGGLRRIYGNNLLSRQLEWLTSTSSGAWARWTVARGTWAAITDEAVRCAESAQPRRVEIPMPGEDNGALEMSCVPVQDPQGADSSVYAFVNYQIDPFGQYARGGFGTVVPLREDTPWDPPGFRYKKNLHHSYNGLGQTQDTNNFGFRDHDVIIPKPAGVFRILCIGGSTTEEGETNESTYPKRLERKLLASFPDRNIEVLNCGIGGLTTGSHLLRLLDYLALEPDLMLVYEGTNDVTGQDSPVALPKAVGPFWEVLGMSRFVRLYCNRLIWPSRAQMAREFEAYTFANLKAFCRIAAQRGIRVAMCSFALPDPDRIPRRELDLFNYQLEKWLGKYMSLPVYTAMMTLYNDMLKDWCGQDGLYYVPVAENLDGGLACFTDYCHMNEAGIERKAEIISRYLKDYIAPALSRPQEGHNHQTP